MWLPIILSGGAGTRLWPVSREAHPKPFIRLSNELSLLQETYLRAAALSGVSKILTVTNREFYFATRDDYQSLSLNSEPFFLLEPFGRNTAPALVLAAFYAQHFYSPETLLLVLPADHCIQHLDRFVDDCEKAKFLAERGKLVTFGVRPERPETGFGYLEISGTDGNVKKFIEKPNLALATEYAASGRHLWNAGILCFRVDAFLGQVKEHAPQLFQRAEACWAQSLKFLKTGNDYLELDPPTFGDMDNISIDYAVMEKSNAVAAVRASFIWSDVGTWDAVSQMAKPDASGNVVVGEAVMVNTTNTFVQSERMVATVGVDNLLVVDTQDAVLIAKRGSTQAVQEVVRYLKKQAHHSYRIHRTVNRPWGAYTILEEGSAFRIRRLLVNPGAQLSLQMHAHRSEHWIVIKGTASVLNGDQNITLQADQSTFIIPNTWHRLANLSSEILVMIEVQTGDYLGEDDIVRLDPGTLGQPS